MMKNNCGLFISQDFSIGSIKKELESVFDLIGKKTSNEVRNNISSEAKSVYDVKGYLKKYEKIIAAYS